MGVEEQITHKINFSYLPINNRRAREEANAPNLDDFMNTFGMELPDQQARPTTLERDRFNKFHSVPCEEQVACQGIPTTHRFTVEVEVGGYLDAGNNNKSICGIVFCTICGYQRGLEDNAFRCRIISRIYKLIT